MKTYKNVKSFLKGIRRFANKQEMAHMRGWDKLPEDVKNLIYLLIASVQNDIAEIEDILNEVKNADTSSANDV
jgi:hypothetical protein